MSNLEFVRGLSFANLLSLNPAGVLGIIVVVMLLVILLASLIYYVEYLDETGPHQPKRRTDRNT